MKIQIDKVSSIPGHSLSVKQIKAALSVLSEDLTSLFSRVRLSNQLSEKSHFDRPVILGMGRLTICDRGWEKYEIVEQIYIELMQYAPETPLHLRSHNSNRFDPKQYKRLEEMAAPYLKAYRKLVF